MTITYYVQLTMNKNTLHSDVRLTTLVIHNYVIYSVTKTLSLYVHVYIAGF